MNCVHMKPVASFGFSLLLLLGLFFGSTACSFSKASRSRKEQQRIELKTRKAEEKAYQQKVKAHQDRQADNTRAMMKQSKKKNKKMMKHFRKKTY